MAAGLGFKNFATGEVLTAADTNGYLMQGVWVFANATARDAAVTSPQEGNFAYLKDTNVTTYYTGSAWANLDTTGMVNPMTTTGDTIYSSSGSTPARLGIGSTGQVLTVAGGLPSWATPSGASANWSLLNSGGTTLSGTATTISGISSKDKIMVIIRGASSGSTNAEIRMRINNNATNVYTSVGQNFYGVSTYQPWNLLRAQNSVPAFIPMGTQGNSQNSAVSGYCLITGAATSGVKVYTAASMADMQSAAQPVNEGFTIGGIFDSSSTVTEVNIVSSVGNFDAGTVFVYTSA
jgi:hypothetical protein